MRVGPYIVIAWCVIANGCGGSGGDKVTGPTQPPPASVATVSATLGKSSLIVGETTTGNAIAKDASGNVLTGRTVTWASSNNAVATVSLTGSVTGVAVGTSSITATSEGQNGSATITVVAVPGTTATKLAFKQTPSANAVSRAPLSVQPIVQLQNSSGESVAQAGVAVTVAIAFGGGVIVGSATAISDATGAASFIGLAIGGSVGSKTLTFSAPGLASVSGITAISAGPPVAIIANFGDNQSAQVETDVLPVSAKVTDIDSNPIAGIPVTFAVVSGGGSLGSSAPQITNSSGNAFASWTLGPVAGTNTLSAAAASLSPSQLIFTATGLARKFAILSAGGDRTCALTRSGSAFCWGASSGQPLGDGGQTDRPTPTAVAGGFTFASISVGLFHTCAVASRDNNYCWGSNQYGQIGDGTSIDRTTPTRSISGGLNATIGESYEPISAGGYQTCVTYVQRKNANFATVCQGKNAIDELSFTVFSSMSLGLGHTCTTAPVRCWGLNSSGQLGDGTTTDRPGPVPVFGVSNLHRISAGIDHTCAITTDVTVLCWGDNSKGQLGDGTTTNRLVPTPVNTALKFFKISAGQFFTCGLTIQGAAYCWGVNTFGQLGDGTTISRTLPTRVVGNFSFQDLDVGSNHVCGIVGPRFTSPYDIQNGDVVCWGFNSRGQLGDNTTTNRASPTPIR